jgi:hypothetical protein
MNFSANIGGGSAPVNQAPTSTRAFDPAICASISLS